MLHFLERKNEIVIPIDVFPQRINSIEHALCKAIGITFGKKTRSGYRSVKVDLDKCTAEKIASLPVSLICKIDNNFSETPLEKEFDDALLLQKYEYQLRRTDIGPLFNTTEMRPLTWGVSATLIRDEIDRQAEKLRRHGVSTLVGFELEFTFYDKPINGFTKWQEDKSHIIATLDQQILAADDAQKQFLILRRDAVKKFTAEQVLMFNLIERNPKTKDILHPLFGASRDGQGYYDSAGVLELKTIPSDPKTALQNREIIIKELHTMANDYGLILDQHDSQHINVSYWQGGKNLLDDKHPGFYTTGRKITAAVAQTMFDAMMTLNHPFNLDRELIPLSLNPDRENILRFSGKRIEIRPGVGGHLLHTEILLPFVMAAATYALDGKKTKKMHPVKPIRTLELSPSDEKFKIIRHVLEGSIVTNTGYLKPPETYIRENSNKIAHELNLTDQNDYSGGPANLLRPDHPLTKWFIRFFLRVKITEIDGEQLIIWPNSTYDRFSFETIGADIPFKTHEIDTDALKRELSVLATPKKFVSVRPEDTNLLHSPTKWCPPNMDRLEWDRRLRLARSQPLRKLSSRFKETLLAQLTQTPSCKFVEDLTSNVISAFAEIVTGDRDNWWQVKMSKPLIKVCEKLGLEHPREYYETSIVCSTPQQRTLYEMAANALFTQLAEKSGLDSKSCFWGFTHMNANLDVRVSSAFYKAALKPMIDVATKKQHHPAQSFWARRLGCLGFMN